jgi:hypothetical protein
MSFDMYIKLLESSPDEKEKRKLFDHLEKIFLTQNNVPHFFSIKIKRLQFELGLNNFTELEQILHKAARERIFLNLIEFYDLLLNHFVSIGNLKKVKENLVLRLKNSLHVKRYYGMPELLRKFEKFILEDQELFQLAVDNLYQQKDYSLLRSFLTKSDKAINLMGYEESLQNLSSFKSLYINQLINLQYHAEEKIDVFLARDLILEGCDDNKSVRYYCKAVLLSSDEELIDDLIQYLKSKTNFEETYVSVLEIKKNYVGDSKTKIDLGKDLLNYTSFSKIKKINDSQILRNLGEETRAVNFHQLASVMDTDATGLIDSKVEPIKKISKDKKVRNVNEEREFGHPTKDSDSFQLEDLICAHLFMGQYHFALKAINQSLKDKAQELDLSSMVNLNYYRILCLIKIGDLSMAMQLTNEFLNELDINNHQYSTFTYLKYLIYLEVGDNDQALSLKAKLARKDPYFKKMTGGLI